MLSIWLAVSKKFLKIQHLFIFGCAGPSLLCGLFSGCGEWRPLSSFGAGFSLQWLLLLQSTARESPSFSCCSHHSTVVVELPGSLEHRLNSCAQVQLNLPGSGIELVSSALTTGLITTEPPGKPHTKKLTEVFFPDVQKKLLNSYLQTSFT